MISKLERDGSKLGTGERAVGLSTPNTVGHHNTLLGKIALVQVGQTLPQTIKEDIFHLMGGGNFKEYRYDYGFVDDAAGTRPGFQGGNYSGQLHSIWQNPKDKEDAENGAIGGYLNDHPLLHQNM